MADHEFEVIRVDFPQLNTAAAGEHVPDIERCIRTIKERTKSTYTMLPFKCVPRLMLIHLVKSAVLWINTFPARDGVCRELNADTHAVSLNSDPMFKPTRSTPTT